MKKRNAILIFSLLLLLVLIIFLVFFKKENNFNNEDFSPVLVEDIVADNGGPEVIIDYPQEGEIISAPLSVGGRAKGTWFFEANIVVSLIDIAGDIITVSGVQASEDWMTVEMVPFQANLDFTIPENLERGYLVISKDNPSGLPEYDASFKIPVKFK